MLKQHLKKRQISSQWPWRSSVQFRISVSSKVIALGGVCHSRGICDLVIAMSHHLTYFPLFQIFSFNI